MTKMRVNYLGNLRCDVEHLASGSHLETDAPVDNKGKGEKFSPTDLLCVSLVTCILTTIAIAAEERGWKFEGATGEFEKVMVGPPRRVGEVNITLTIPSHDYTDEIKTKIERYVQACPVSRSLHPDVQKTVTIQFV